MPTDPAMKKGALNEEVATEGAQKGGMPIERESTASSLEQEKSKTFILGTTKSPPRIRLIISPNRNSNRHSVRDRKGVSTYNVKTLAGTSIHTPRKFTNDVLGNAKATSRNVAKASKDVGVVPKSVPDVPAAVEQVISPQPFIFVPKSAEVGIITSLAPLTAPIAPKSATAGQSAAKLPLKSALSGNFKFKLLGSNVPGLPAIPSVPTQKVNNITRVPFIRVRLIVNKNKADESLRVIPVVTPKPPAAISTNKVITPAPYPCKPKALRTILPLIKPMASKTSPRRSLRTVATSAKNSAGGSGVSDDKVEKVGSATKSSLVHSSANYYGLAAAKKKTKGPVKALAPATTQAGGTKTAGGDFYISPQSF